MSLKDLEKELQNLKNPQKAKIYQRFFKTGKGEYGEGDVFLGLTVPQCQKVASNYVDLSLNEVQKLLKNKIHEYRWSASMILNRQYKKADPTKKKQIVDYYLKNTTLFNNWDLVDGSAPSILGDFLINNDRNILYKLVKSENLWERRISIMSTFAFIKNDDFKDSLKIAEILLPDKHDLIHKAVGWMLREIGKRDQEIEEKFLMKYHQKMPRTMLRYAIEKFDGKKRKFYLDLK